MIAVKTHSNLAHLQLKCNIKNGTLYIDKKKSYIKLKEILFKKYKVPLKVQAFSSIVLKGKIDSNSTEMYAGFIAKDIFKDKTFPKTDIKGVVVKLKGDFTNDKFILGTKIKLTLPMAKSISIASKVDLKTLKYVVKVVIPKLSLKNKNYPMS